jgi:hypothetical protein
MKFGDRGGRVKFWIDVQGNWTASQSIHEPGIHRLKLISQGFSSFQSYAYRMIKHTDWAGYKKRLSFHHVFLNAVSKRTGSSTNLLSLMCKFGNQTHPGGSGMWRGGTGWRDDTPASPCTVQPSPKPSQEGLNLHDRFPLVYSRKGVVFPVMGWGEYYSPHIYTTTPRAWCSWHHILADVHMTNFWLGVGRVPRLVRGTLYHPSARYLTYLLTYVIYSFSP